MSNTVKVLRQFIRWLSICKIEYVEHARLMKTRFTLTIVIISMVIRALTEAACISLQIFCNYLQIGGDDWDDYRFNRSIL